MKVSHIPNALTLLRVVLTPVFLYLLYLGTPDAYVMSFFVFLFASLSDWADGSIARKYGYSSEFGQFMDPLADKVLVISTFLAFWLMGFAELWMVLIVIFRDVLITLFRSYMKRRGKSMRTSGIAKAKTTIQMIFIYTVLSYLLIENFRWLSVLRPVADILFSHQVFWVLMLLTAMLTFYTGILYFFENKHVFNDGK